MMENSGKLSKIPRRGMKKIKTISVDLQKRMERSFGKPIGQMVEIHYQGKPMTFKYSGSLETLSIDVLHREENKEQLKKGNKVSDIPVEQFDASKRRLDMATVNVSCTCGAKFTTTIPVATARLGNKQIKKSITDEDIKEHIIQEGKNSEHLISIDYVEIHDEVIPETERIKDFDQKKVNFYRIFSKKTTEVKYLASYDQDLLAEAPQIKFSESSAGATKIRMQNLYLMFFLFGVVEIFTYIFALASSASYVYHPHTASYLPWYVTIFTVIVAIVVVWWVKIHEMGKTMVKYITLQSAPFFISNRGVLPVVMTNSSLNNVWDYQAKVMKSTDRDAKDIYYSLTTWSDAQISELYRAKLLGQVEHELTVINTEIRDIQKLDMEYRTQTNNQKATVQQLLLVGIGVFAVYTIILFILGAI